jgi:hypothetical protein
MFQITEQKLSPGNTEKLLTKKSLSEVLEPEHPDYVLKPADIEYLNFTGRSVIKWRDIETASKCAPEHQKTALYMAFKWLGYYPEPHDYLPHLAFIQTLMDGYTKQLMPGEAFLAEIVFHMKAIRNRDMKSGGWVRFKERSDADYRSYETILSVYKHQARERLCFFLGYEPKVEYSLDAEIMLRQLFERDYYHTGMPPQQVDHKAWTITRYRELLITSGEQVADNSDLMGHYRDIEFYI